MLSKTSILCFCCTMVLMGCTDTDRTTHETGSASSSSFSLLAPDVSSSAESDVAGITVTYPNGGESLKAFTKNVITWNAVGLENKKVNISLEQWDGANVPGKSQWIAFSLPAIQGSYEWTPNDEIPYTLHAGRLYKVKVSVENGMNSDTNTMDESDGFFSIAADVSDQLSIRKIGDDTYEIRSDAFKSGLIPSFTQWNDEKVLVSVVTDGTLTCATNATHLAEYGASCLERSSEGAAGSVYYTYTAKVVNDMGIVTIQWVLRETTCGPQYDTMEEVETCEKNRAAFWQSYMVEPIVKRAISLVGSVR